MFTVVDPPRQLAWRTCGLWGHVDSTEWRMTLEPADGGTRILQTYDVLNVAPGMDQVYWLLITAHRDRREALTRDVDRLAFAVRGGFRGAASPDPQPGMPH